VTPENADSVTPSYSRYSVAVVTRAELAGCEAWIDAFPDQRKDYRYYEILEDTLRDDFEYAYFAIRDEAGTTLAVQPFILLDQDILEGVDSVWKQWAERIRRTYPRFLKLRTLMVGCSAGEGHLAAGIGLSSEDVARILSRDMVKLAKASGVQLVVMKEFPVSYRQTFDCFLHRGFARVPSMPMTMLNIQYDNFENYMQQALTRNSRWALRKKLKATAGEALVLSVTDDVEALVDELYPLYLQTFERSKLRFEKLTKEYFIELSRRMKDKVRFLLWHRAGKLVAFSHCMVEGDCVFSEYIGFDYSIALDLHLYFYTARDFINWAIQNRYKWIRSSGLNYEPKLRMRHVLDPIDLYVRHTSSPVNAIFRLVLPWIAPVRYDATLKKFANYQDMW
jgi:predicted N-acyltransferase